MRKWIIMAFLAIMPVLAYSGPSSVTTPSSGLKILDAMTDTTSADTSNCIDLYKPYRIVIPPGTDSLVGRVLLQEFADYLDLQVDEIYARVRDAVCAKLTQDSLIPAESLSLPCKINADTLWPCSQDTLVMIYQAIAVKDTGTARDIGASVLMYEGLNDSSTTDGVAGPEFAGFVVNRANGSGNADTNSIAASYLLVMPPTDGLAEESGFGPGNGNYSQGAVAGNSELLSDSKGNLYWMDRDAFERMMVDTIIADTGIGGNSATGILEVFAERVRFKQYDEVRSRSGKWSGSGAGVIELELYEAPDNGTSKLTLRPNEAMDASWDIQFPDTIPEWNASALVFNSGLGANQAPKWIPYDDEIILRGTDTVSCKTSSKTINVRSRTKHAGQGEMPPPDTKYSWYVAIDVIDLIIRTDHTPDDTNFAPSVGTRRDSIYVYQELNMDFFDTDNPQNEPSGAYFTTDSTFTIKTPQVGCDTVIGIHWMAIGRSEKYLGRGN